VSSLPCKLLLAYAGSAAAVVDVISTALLLPRQSQTAAGVMAKAAAAAHSS
jgi:hypothetical protein